MSFPEKSWRDTAREIRLGADSSLRGLVWGDLCDEASPGTDAEKGVAVLLHGMGDSADVWRPVVHNWLCSDHYAILAIDLPGHGRSHPMPGDDYREALLTYRIASALKAIGIVRPLLVGHSRGARIALGLSRAGIESCHIALIEMGIDDTHQRHAAIVAHVRKMATPAPSLQALLARCSEALPLANPHALSEVVAAMATRTPDGWRFPTDLLALTLLDDPSAPQAFAALHDLSCPLTVMRGAFSALVSRQELTRIERATRTRVKTCEIQCAGHALLVEQPRAVAEILAITAASAFAANVAEIAPPAPF